MTNDIKTTPLGRGLSSLFGPEISDDVKAENQILDVNINDLCPGQYQPRQYFDSEYLDSLVNSIQTKGIIQPILVRTINHSLSSYEIIAGERRWQAAKKCGLSHVPVIVREMNNVEALETALIENIQRHELTPLEEARGYKRLMEEFNYTQDDLAKSLGKSRSHIANQLRILSLPDTVKIMIDKGLLNTGHAKAIAGRNDVEKIAQEIIDKKLNVRQTEKLVQTKNNSQQNFDEQVNNHDDIASLQQHLTDTLQMPTQLSLNKKEKKLVIHFATMENLEMLVNKLSN